MTDIASLSIEIDSTSADGAVKSLRDLAQQGKVTESTLKQTGDSGRNLKRVSSEAESASRSMGLLESAAKGALAALSIREVVQTADSYTQLTAQIKLVTNSTQEYARAYQSVRDISRSTQADLSSTAMLYARIANATKDMGASQQTVADITEAVNLSLRVSGASAQEASSAMLQLSQAFAGGVLRGEEFNSVIESSPRLIQAIAEGMGVTVGQMRSLAAEGKITAEVMADVLPQALGKLREEAQHVQTISGAFTNLKNEVLELVGTQAQTTGFTTAVSGGLNLLANNLNLVVAAATTLGAARVMGALVTGITALGSASAVAGAALSMLGGPVGILTGTLVAGAFAWNAYRDSIDATRNALTSIDAPIDQVVEKFRKLSELEQQIALRGLADAVKEAEADLSEAFDNLAKVPLRLRNSPAFAQFKDDLAALKKQSDDGSISFEELSARVSELVESFKEANPGVRAAHGAIERAGVAVIEVARHVSVLNERNKALKGSTEGVADSLDRAAIAAARAAAGLNTKEWDTFIQKAEAAATTVGMTAQQLGEFQARAMGASEAQSQLAGVLHGMADTARQLEKATADKDFKAIKGAQDTLAALAQQEVQLRVNIRQAEAYAALLAMGLSQASALQGSQTEAELEGLRAMEEVLQRIQNLRDNIENSTKPSKSATSAAEKATKAINDQIKALQLQAATVGMVEDQVTLYKLATEGATKAQLANAKAALDARRAGELSIALAKRGVDTSNEAIKAAAEEARRNQDLSQTYGMSAAGIEQLTVARIEHELARAQAEGKDQEEIERLKMLIELRQQSVGALVSLEQKEQQKQQWESWARDVEQIFDRVGQSLTDAIFDGGKSGKDLLRDLFKGLTFNILINPVMNQLQGWVTNQLGGMFGVQNPQQQGGGILGMAQNLNSAYQAYSGGWASNIGQGAQWLGKKIGSEALQQFGMGMTGATGAPGTVAGITNVGSGLSSSLTQTIGTSGAVLGGGSLALGSGLTASLSGTVGTTAIAAPTFSAALGGGAAAAGTAGAGAAGAAGASGAAAAGAGAASAIPYVGIAIAVASILSSVFGGREPTTRRAEWASADLMPDGNVVLGRTTGRLSDDAQEGLRSFTEKSVAAINETFTKLGAEASVSAFSAILDTSIKGDKQGVGTTGFVRVGDQDIQVGIPIESGWSRDGVGGWSAEDMGPRLEADMRYTFMQAMQAASSQLPETLAGMLEGIDIRGLDLEQLSTLEAAFNGVIAGVSALQEAIEKLPFANLRDLTFDAYANLVQFAGGMENLDAGLTTYFQNFYSEGEQLDFLSTQLSTALKEVGLAMPDVTQGADAAKTAYRAMVESLDVTTEEGQKAYATMITLSGGFAELAVGMEELGNSAAGVGGQLGDAAKQLMEDILKEREPLERQIMALMGDVAGLRQLELDALHEANRPLQERIWALQEEKDLLSERDGLERQLLQLQGNTAEIRRRDLQGLNESNRALQTSVWAMQDFQSAVQRTSSVMSQQATLINSLHSALGNTQAVREAQLAGMDPANREAQLALWGLQDADKAAEDAYRALAASVAAEKARLQKEAAAMGNSIRTAIDSASESVRRLNAIAGQLQSTLQGMVTTGTDPERDYGWGRGRLSRAVSVATLTGVLPEGDDFEAALQIVAQPSEGLFASFEDYQAEFLGTAHDIEKLQRLTDKQLTTEERALKAMERQMSASQSWHDAEIARLDAMLAAERERIDIAKGTYEAALSLPTALAGIGTAIQALADAQKTAQRVIQTQSKEDQYFDAKLAQLTAIGSMHGGIDWSKASVMDLRAYFAQEGLTPQEHWEKWGKYEGLRFPGFAVGTNYVQHDMLANIHKGEIIIDPRSSDILRRYGIGVQSAGNDHALRLVQQELREMRRMQQTLLEEIGRNTDDTARTNRQMTEQPQPVHVTNVVPTIAAVPGT